MRKTLCLLLAAALACGCLLPFLSAAPARAAGTPAAPAYPVVIARGMEFDGIYTNYGTDAQQRCFRPITAGGILKTLALTVKNAFTMGLRHGFAVAAVDYVREILGDMACDERGESVLDVGYDRYFGPLSDFPEFLASVTDDENKEPALARTAAERFGAENVYYYTYDFRLDPMVLADDLRAYIELAKAQHGTDKVILVNCSMAGVITDCYLYKYGSGSLAKVIFLSSTFCGTDEATQILQKNLQTSGGQLYQYLRTTLGDRLIWKGLYTSGALDAVARIANRFLDNEKDYVFDAFLRDSFGTMLSFWANVQPGEVGAAVDAVFPTPELKARYAPLLEKIDALRAVMEGREAMLRALPGQGVQVAVVAGYGRSNVPLYPDSVRQADGILDARWMLGGAAVSRLDGGEPVTGPRCSPDAAVELSGVLFPDATWAIKNAGHVPVKYGSDCSDFVTELIRYDGQPDVTAFPRFPQFFTVDAATKNLIGGGGRLPC